MAKIWIKYLVLILYLILLITIGVLIGFFGAYKCTRKACLRKVNFIISNMDQKVNPCEDFYKFSCNNYKEMVKKYNELKTDGFTSVLHHIKVGIEEVIDDFLQSKIKVADDRLLKILKKMYQPCVNNLLITKQGIQPMWDSIWMSGGIPVVDGDDWNEKAFSIGKAEYKSQKNGFKGGHIFKSFIAQDLKAPQKYSIYLKPPSYKNQPGHELITTKYSKILHDNYLSFLVRLTFHLLGKGDYESDDHKLIRERYENELNKSVAFKLELKNQLQIYWKEQDPVNLYNRMSVENLQKDFPYVDWKDYFKTMLPPSTQLPKQVIVIGTSYFKGIKELLEKTRKRDVANYVMLENVIEASLFLPPIYFAIYNKFRTNIKLPIITKRWQFCRPVVTETLKGALSSLFLETYNFTEGSQPILQEMAELMRKDLKQSIESLNWMDEKTKQRAILKLKKTKFTLSLSDRQLSELHDVEARAKYYEDLCLSSRLSHVLPSYFCINKFFNKRNWELLSRKPTVFDEDIDVFSSEIKYNQKRNEIFIPYAVLKYPAFDGKWPGYVNYGGIGGKLGNVFTTGYDLEGSKFNDMGFQQRWWTESTEIQYKQQRKCFQNDFFTYVKFNNITTRTVFQDDNPIFGDIDGVNLAYHAYLNYYNKRYLKEQSLPGLEQFTAQQLFFISYANIYCSYYRSKKRIYDLQNTIAPIDLNVMSSLQNFKEFSTAFNCKRGDEMNPSKKCNFLWAKASS